MSRANAYWSGKKQPRDMVEKRAASMRGQKRKPYKQWSDESKQRHREAMAAKRLEPGIGCINCKQIIRPTGFSRHLVKCITFQCKIAECSGSIRLGALGYCGFHYLILKGIRQHGLTLESYLALYEHQDGKCAICSRPGLHRGHAVGNENKNAVMCIDHDHATNKVRGLICHPCNVTLGLMNDDPKRLRAAADYLEEHDD